MSSDAPPHTMLAESIRTFAAEIENVTRRLAELGTSGDAAAAAGDAVAQLRQAQDEIAAEAEELRELLEAERLRYRDLFEWAPDAYLVTDPRGTIREANRAAERLLGRGRELLFGKPLMTLLAPEERTAFGRTIERLGDLELVSDWELTVTRAGEAFPAALTVSTIRDVRGSFVGLRWLVRDVSDRREAENQMLSTNIELDRRVTERTEQLEAAGREKEEAVARLEAVLDQIPAAIVIADAASRRIVSANEHAARLVSDVVGSGEALDHWLSIGFHADGRPFAIAERPIMRALATGENVAPQAIEFHRLDGTRASYETTASPIRNVDGDVVAAVAAYWDLTERERLARAEREFVTNAAHELRTPLAALASSVEVLESGAKDDPGHRDRFLGHIADQSERLQRLVRSLLLLARLQTLQETAEPEEIPVRALLTSVGLLGPPERVRVDDGTPEALRVLAHRDLAEQALLNLVSNAEKYAPEGEIVLRSAARNGYVALEVTDSGPGMTSEEAELAPIRFFRGRDDVDGFGLGLSIARQAAEALGGRLELESDGVHGTTARLLLPLARGDG